MPLITNAKSMWVKIAQPETKYGSDATQWSINLVVEDEVSRKWVKDGLAMKERFMDVDGKEACVIKIKKDTHWAKSGDAKTPVKVVDKFGQDVDASKIGNGSIVNVQYSVKDWEFQGRKGRTPELMAVQVIELVEYAGGANKSAGDEFDFLTQEEVSLTDDVNLDDDVFN